MAFKPWNELTRISYIVIMILLFSIPLITGFVAAVLQPWSDFWWDVTVKLFYVWSSWVLLCALFGWHNHHFARLFPLVLLINIASLLALVPLWRTAKESYTLGWILFLSHLAATLFAYIYCKEWILKDYSKVGVWGRLLIGLVILGPILWIIILITLNLFNLEVIKPLGGALCFYYLNMFFVSLSIRFREPDWNPKKKVSL
jgi:hypothetical protein